MTTNPCISRDAVLRALEEHRAELERFGLKSLMVFGSAARDEATLQSDVDVLVEFAEPVGLFRFLDLKDRLETILDRRVDLVTPEALKRQLRGAVLREAIHAW